MNMADIWDSLSQHHSRAWRIVWWFHDASFIVLDWSWTYLHATLICTVIIMNALCYISSNMRFWRKVHKYEYAVTILTTVHCAKDAFPFNWLIKDCFFFFKAGEVSWKITSLFVCVCNYHQWAYRDSFTEWRSLLLQKWKGRKGKKLL